MSLKNKLQQRRDHLKNEDGASLVELVVAIPIIFILFSVIFVSLGMTSALMKTVNSDATATKTLKEVTSSLQSSENCITLQQRAKNYVAPEDSGMLVEIDPITCPTEGKSLVSVHVVVKNEKDNSVVRDRTFKVAV